MAREREKGREKEKAREKERNVGTAVKRGTYRRNATVLREKGKEREIKVEDQKEEKETGEKEGENWDRFKEVATGAANTDILGSTAQPIRMHYHFRG